MTGRERLLQTSEGSTAAAFGVAEWALLAVVGFVWGSSFLFIAEGLEAFGPGLISWLRLALGFATLSLFRTARAPIARADHRRIAALAVLWMAIPFILIPMAQQSIDSSLAGMINGGMPLFAAAISAIMLRRLPGKAQSTGLVVGFAGIVLVSLPSGDASATLTGVVLTLVATACYGLAVNLAVPLQQTYGALPVLLRALGIALIVTTPLGIASLASATWSWTSLAAVAALGVGGTALAYVAMATLAGRAGATRGAVAIYLIPLVAIGLGVWLRDEEVAALGLVGIGLALVGAWVTSRAETR